MSEQESLLFKAEDLCISNFSKMPVIRTFKSILTDEEFAFAGLTVEHSPGKNTSFIYPAAKFIRDDSENEVLSNALVSRRSVQKTLYVDPLCVTLTTAPDLSLLKERIDQLRELATDDDVSFDEASASEAIGWLRTAKPPILPSVFLVNNGNIRLLWRSEERQLGIQFLGNGAGQFVFLGQDDQADRVFGTRKVSELLKLLRGLDLATLLGF